MITIQEDKSISVFKDLKEITAEEFFKKVKILYSEQNDTIVLQTPSNLLISAENNIITSNNDTIILSGASGTSGTGNIHLNPNKINIDAKAPSTLSTLIEKKKEL